MTEPEAGIRLVDRARDHPDRTAVVDAAGEHSYRELLVASSRVAGQLLARHGGDARDLDGTRDPDGAWDLDGARVAYMVEPGFRYAAVQWGIWRAGGIAVPLCLFHPARELAYVLDDTAASLVVADPAHRDLLEPLARERDAALLASESVLAAEGEGAGGGSDPGSGAPGGDSRLPRLDPDRRALILYTSGTTGRPKGVVHTHRSLEAQVTSLVEAWGWRPEDEILHVLPLHHTHGLVNALLCALWTGASCRMLPGFDAAHAWSTLAETGVSLFMGVPTMYVKLIRHWRNASERDRERLSRAARGLRLAVSGSAALPVPVFEAWEEITGEPLLERYGMTEIGMALSNPLDGERRPGHVGRPLPGVEVRLVDEAGVPIGEEDVPGQIEVRGPNVFDEYWRRPEVTLDAFRDGWFVTGDEAVVQEGYYRILGRTSVDIINTGGYKVSALEVEEVLLRHEGIEACAVVGVDDPEWGERVCVAVVGDGPAVPELEELRTWAKERLAPYKVPSRLLVLDELPRNAVGKVTKPDVESLFRDETEEEA